MPKKSGTDCAKKNRGKPTPCEKAPSCRKTEKDGKCRRLRKADIPEGMRFSKAKRNVGKNVLVEKRVLPPSAMAKAFLYRAALMRAGYMQPGEKFRPFPKKGTAEYRRVKRMAASLRKTVFAQGKFDDPYLASEIAKHLPSEDIQSYLQVNKRMHAQREEKGPMTEQLRKRNVEEAVELTIWVNDNIIHHEPGRMVIHDNGRPLPRLIGRLTYLTELRVQACGLKELPNSIGKLINLQYLGFYRNKLTSLPDSIGNLIKLKRLDVSKNKLTSLPDSFGNLTALKILELGWNKLTSLPDSIGNLTKLDSLDLQINKLTSLPDSIGNLVNLRSLGLSYNKLTSLPDSLLKLNAATSIDVTGNDDLELTKKMINRLFAGALCASGRR